MAMFFVLSPPHKDMTGPTAHQTNVVILKKKTISKFAHQNFFDIFFVCVFRTRKHVIEDPLERIHPIFTSGELNFHILVKGWTKIPKFNVKSLNSKILR